MRNSDVTIFVVDDDEAILDSMRCFLEYYEYQVETHRNGQSFLESYRNQMGCLILDINMPKLDGFQLQQELLRRQYCLPVIFITGHGDVKDAVRALKGGAFYYLEKPFTCTLLLAQVRQAIETDLMQRQQKRQREEMLHRFEQLTPREEQILDQIATGKGNKAMAEALHVSIPTIETHRRHIMEKMRAKNSAQLIYLAHVLSRRRQCT